MAGDRSDALSPGDRVVIRTPDRREFRGVLVEWRLRQDGRRLVVVRLDTGWLTTYPAELVFEDEA